MEPTTDFSTILSILLSFGMFLIVFPLFWIAVVYLVSLLSGWGRLAQYYQTTSPFNGQTYSWQSGYFNWARYNGVLVTGGDRDYLYLAVSILFRVGHPPLLIPWYDITTEEGNWYFMKMVVLQFNKVPNLKMRIPAKQAARLLALRDEM